MHDHHAYLIFAPSLAAAELPADAAIPSVDVEHNCLPQFGIDDARRLAQKAVQKPVASAIRTFVIAAASLTPEAQNALLKLFEDPPLHARFYLIVPHESSLLPTLRSRLFAAGSAVSEDTGSEVREFLARSVAERLQAIADMQKRKDAEGMQRLASMLIAHVARHAQEYPPRALHAANLCDRHIRLKGAAKKMLLEHLALALADPRTK